MTYLSPRLRGSREFGDRREGFVNVYDLADAGIEAEGDFVGCAG